MPYPKVVDSSGGRTRNLQLARGKGLRPLTRRLVHYPIVLWSHGNIFPNNIICLHYCK